MVSTLGKRSAAELYPLCCHCFTLRQSLLSSEPASTSLVAGIIQVWVTTSGFSVVSPGWCQRYQGQENPEGEWLLGGLMLLGCLGAHLADR